MTGWEQLWQNEDLVRLWAEFPPVPESVEMADRLQAENRWRVLDIGCGMGRHTIYLASRGFKVTAIDNAPTALAKCRERLAEYKLNAEIAEGDMENMSYGPASFDGVLSTNVIHHVRVATLQRIIADIHRMLTQDGYFVWVTPNTRHCDWDRGEEIEPGTWVDPTLEFGNPHHFCTEEEARELLKAFTLISLNEMEAERDGRFYYHWRILAQKL
jgi:tellurite methyltransferase